MNRFCAAVAATICAMLAAGPGHASIVYALVDPAFLLRFDSNAPATITHMTMIGGLQQGERIAGIDFRPRTGQLYGVGVAADNATIRVYVINPLSGQATTVPGSTPFTVTPGNVFGVDFNPTADRIRVVNDAGENFRINPNNGARADSPTGDSDLTPAGQLIADVAHDRNTESGFAVVNRTTLYGINVPTSALVTVGGLNQSPSPNGGALSNVGPLGVSLAPGSNVGFDIRAGSGIGFASLRPTSTNLTGLYSVNLSTGAATLIGPIGNGSFRIVSLAAVPPNVQVIGAGPGGGPHVRMFESTSGAPVRSFLAYDPSFTGGVRVAVGDVNGDGIPDAVTAPGPGAASNVRVFDGVTGAIVSGAIGSFDAFPSFTGGVYVAAGDVNGDGFKDVVVGAGTGASPLLRVYSGATGAMLLDINAFDPAFTGGVRVGAIDFDRDGDTEPIAATGPGTEGRVRIFNAAGNPFTTAALPNFVNDFIPYPGFTGGVSVAAGDLNGDGIPDLVTAPGAGGGPHVRVFSGANGAVLLEFLAYEASFTGGVSVSVGDVNGDGRYDIVTAPLSGRAADIKAFDGRTGQLRHTFNAFPGAGNGASVAGVRE